MFIDAALLFCYALIAGVYRKTLNLAILLWFAVSMILGSLMLPALVTFPIYWLMALGMMTYAAVRGSWCITVSMGTMALLQLAMSVDSLITNTETSLYNNYTILALLVNLFIMGTSFYHGTGLDSVGNNNNHPVHHHHNKNH